MSFVLGKKSLKELEGCKPSILKLAHLAIKKTLIDFTIFDGMRTMAEHLANVAKGVSKAKVSKHVLGEAMDAVPLVNGKPVWDPVKCVIVARGVQQAARELNIPITWGAVWDRDLCLLSDNLEKEVKAYIARRKAQKLSAFLDYPHFELR